MTARQVIANLSCAVAIIAIGGFSIVTRTIAAERLPLPVDLELVIAADASDSMDPDERWLQRAGFASAFRDPEIIRALSSGPLRRIAVTYVEWADIGQPQVIVPWMVIDNATSAHSFAQKLLAMRLVIMRKTSISGALLFSSHLIENNGIEGTRRVIDVSGDGPNNQGYPVMRARDDVIARGIVINGLPIQLKKNIPGNPFGPSFDMKKLDIYYEDCVIGGPGAFIVSVKSREELVSGIRRKLLLEIAGLQPRLINAGFGAKPRAPRISC